MSAPSKTRKGATHASNNNKSGAQATSVSSRIKKIIESELVPTNEKYIVRDEHKRAQCYQANFSFQGDLRKYLDLQNQVSRERKKLSGLISFTSAYVGPDALAVSASTYVKHTWACDGTKLLQMVDASMQMGSDSPRKVYGKLPSGCDIWITVDRNDIKLTILGGLKKSPRSSIVGVIEQICWLVSVAGDTPIRCLAKYVEELKQDTAIREYSETIYTGDPVIGAGDGICFSVSFTEPAQPFSQANQTLVKTSGHCWKTMAGVTIIANGFAIPSRPRQGSGLEASLSVLRELIKRGYHGSTPLVLDRPMVVFPPSKVATSDRSGPDSTVFKLRYILAAGIEHPLRKRGNVVYWHFDGAKICHSEQSLEQLEQKVRVHPAAIDPESRHFVGWTSNAGHLAAAPKEIPLGAHSDCIPCPHYKLVIPTLSGTLRLPAGPFSWNATLGAEKIETKITVADMLTAREQQLHHVSARLFVLWDKFSERGWLVGGDTVALHLLRVYAHRNERSKLQNFDFMSLKNLGTDAASAYNVLAELNVLAASEEEGEEVLGPYLNEVYSMLLRLPEQMLELLRTHALSTPFERWYDRHFGTSFFGADFDELTRSSAQPEVYTYKLGKDPGWLKWAKEEKLTFLFASGLGEVLEPKAGSSCPCFPTLPTGENFLASELRILKRLITKHAGVESCFPPEKTVARLSRGHGWERRLDPFPSQKCQGDHLNTPRPTCFPVQSTLPAPLLQRTKERQKKDVELLQNKALYTVKDFNDMIHKNPSGVVVFGHQPKLKELGDISRQSRRSSQSDHQQQVTATSAQSSGRPGSHGSASGSTTSRTLPAPEMARNRAESSSSASAQRTPSTTSVRSSGSGTHVRPVQGNGSVAARPLESTPRSPATSVRKAASNMSLRSIVSNTRSRASQGDGGGAGRAQSSASQSPSTAVHRAASGASSRGTGSDTHSAPQGVASGNNTSHVQPQVVASPSMATARRAASNASLRSIGSNTHAVASHSRITGNITGSGQPQVLSSRSPAPSIRQAASNASLRSISSTTRSVASNGEAGRSNGSSAVINAQIPTKMVRNSSIRTTSSAASRAATGSQLQRPSAQASDMGLKKTATNSSDRTTSSQSSRVAQNLEAFNSNRQQQQLAAAQPTSSNQGTSPVGANKNPHPSSSGPAPAAASGPDFSS